MCVRKRGRIIGIVTPAGIDAPRGPLLRKLPHTMPRVEHRLLRFGDHNPEIRPEQMKKQRLFALHPQNEAEFGDLHDSFC